MRWVEPLYATLPVMVYIVIWRLPGLMTVLPSILIPWWSLTALVMPLESKNLPQQGFVR